MTWKHKDSDNGSLLTKKTKTSSGATPAGSSSGFLNDDAMRAHWKKNTINKVGFPSRKLIIRSTYTVSKLITTTIVQ